MTVTVTERVMVPPAPVQLSEKVLLAASAPVDSLPAVDFAPDQAPEAVQLPVLSEDQASVAACPAVTEVGITVNDNVGAGGGGDVPCTVTVTVSLTAPPAPVQVSEKLLEAASGPVVSVPDVALVPDQAPEAWQDVTFDDDQERIDVSP